MENLGGKRVTVIGLGRFGGGVGVTRWLCGQGARVTVSDKAAADTLTESIKALDGLDAVLHLGGHLEDDCEILTLSEFSIQRLPDLKLVRRKADWTKGMRLVDADD